MDFFLLTMRLLHILLGAFWAGALVFTAFFLLPSIREAGPDGAKVIAGLMRRQYMNILPVVAAVSILSGFWLYWKMSGGFQPEYMRSPMGQAFGLGAVTAILAFLLGVIVVRPSMLRAAKLAEAAAGAPPGERDARMAEVQALRMRAGKAGSVVALLLVLTVAAMAVARYL